MRSVAIVTLLPWPVIASEHEPALDIPTASLALHPASATLPDTPPIVFLPRTAEPKPLDRRSGVLFAQAGATPPHTTGQADAPATPPWGSQKSYLIPALEIFAFDFLLNRFDNAYFGCCDFDVSGSSIRRNLKSGWVVDRDSFTVNQLGHPYQGSMYHGFARASGLDYWPALAYTFMGSALWEIAGETTRPSRNDQISTGIGGSFLGEALFRMSNLWLERSKAPPFLREAGAAVVSPPVGFNRLAFDKRFDGIFQSNDPEYYSRVQIGWAAATQNEPGTSREVKRHEALLDFALDYGLPGKPGYTYKRPFDYFAFQAAASSAVGFDSVMTRGLLFGTGYDVGKNYRGIWGLYGSYDYMAPQVFRMASTAASLGTTAEWRLSNALTVQGTGLAGVGYATVSTIGGIRDERSNQYGVAPQALLALRLIMAERASVDITAREYFISHVSAGSSGGHDNVVRTDASVTWRVHKQHAVTLRYQMSQRDSSAPGVGDLTTRRGTVGIFYTLLGRDRFGTGDW
jgi:hypothetical protein